ncbi:SO_0444 family Cu/Zn efflux transporter [Marinomonas mediterranea]|uniref:SO_0444 family Cu/Zn efflux transporter n=1 Tax=Marinomonas mediterranea TaxID=119864 RepID=UPI002349E02B|nr:SO_0444 family Cu/Zn efflux transporter [Marinomonas mediterranea]WCN07539.1 SO_0444 family Cu/Zn efflux transporter [Marinomonas mediterranea]
MAFLNELVNMFLISAPWLLLGFIAAGLMNAFIPMNWMKDQLGQDDLKSVIKAALFGAPLPLCSCGVIPAAIGLRKAGASKAATTSFLVSTPETGVDSISLSYALMGPIMAIVRPIAAVSSAILAGLLVGKNQVESSEKGDQEANLSHSSSSTVASCCSQKHAPEKLEKRLEKKLEEPKANSESSSHCCASKTSTAEKSPSSGIYQRAKSAFGYATGDLIENTVVWLVIGLGFAALIQTYLPKDFLIQWGDSFVTMLVMILISVPMYICATASTPIAAGLMLAGVSPGAVLVFMMAGPATNIATLGVITHQLGKRALFGYLGGVIGGALSFGLLLDYMLEQLSITIVPAYSHDHSDMANGLSVICAALLAVLFLKAVVKKINITSLRRA